MRVGPRCRDLVRLSPEEEQVAGAEPEDPVNEVEQDLRSDPDPTDAHPEIMLCRQRLRRVRNRAQRLLGTDRDVCFQDHHSEISQHATGVDRKGEKLHPDPGLVQKIIDCHDHRERDGDDLRETVPNALPAGARQIQKIEFRHGHVAFEVTRNHHASQFAILAAGPVACLSGGCAPV